MGAIAESKQALAVICSFEGLKFELITVATSEELIDLIKKLKPLENKMERDFVFHHTFLGNMSEALDPIVKATWIADSFDIEGVPVNGENILISLSQLIDLAVVIEPNVPTITSVTPNPAAQGAVITFTGSTFSNINKMTFIASTNSMNQGDVEVTPLIISDNEMTAIVPTLVSGAYTINVRTTDGLAGGIDFTKN